MLEQVTFTINLLQQSGLHPHLSAYAHAFQPFNYARTPLAPPGIKILVHERATEQGTFDPHTIPGWYLGPEMHHYCCYRVWIPETSSVLITDNVTWLPHNTPLPTATTEDLIVASANDLTTTLLHQKLTDLLLPLHAETHKALLQLSTIFAN